MLRYFPILLLFHPAVAGASDWRVLPEASHIGWTAKWNTSPVRGGFERFSADIRFDAAALEQASVQVEVDVASIYLEGQDARSTLTNENWFAAMLHPLAVFEATRFRDLGNGRYEASGDLTIRGTTRPATLPFKLTIEGDTARMEGGLVLDRTEFGIGLAGDFASAVAPEVDVSVAVTAVRE